MRWYEVGLDETGMGFSERPLLLLCPQTCPTMAPTMTMNITSNAAITTTETTTMIMDIPSP